MIQILICSQSQNLRDNHAWTVSPSQSLKILIVSFFNLIHISLEYLWDWSSLIWESLVLGGGNWILCPLVILCPNQLCDIQCHTHPLTFCENVRKVELSIGLPRWLSDIEFACQCRRCRRHEFAPWIRQIPWRRKWQLAPVFLPWEIPWTEEPGRLQSTGSQKSWTMYIYLCISEELILSNCGAEEGSWESFGLQWGQTS